METPTRPLLALAAGLTLALACTTVTNLLGGEEPAVLPGTAPPPTETAEPQAAPTEVRRRALAPSPTPFHVTDPDDPRALLDLSRPDYVDYFDDPEAWFDYDTPGRAAYHIEEGHLVALDYEPEEIYTWWTYSSRLSDNVYAEVSATNGDCIGKDAVGLVVRVDPEKAAGGYALEVSCDGHWRFVRHRIGKQPQVLIDWTPSEAIQAGAFATNRLGIWAYQRDFAFFINGQLVGETRDPPYSYKAGLFGLYVRALQTYDLTATFDDFAFWRIPYQTP